MSSAIEILRNVTTGTITTMLLKKGIRHSWMAGAMPFGFSGKRVVGPAFTLRFVPVREDLATLESWSKRYLRAAPLRSCRRTAWWWLMPWASPAPAFLVTFCA